MEGLGIILTLYSHVQVEILPDKHPEVITEHFTPAVLRECMSTLFNGKMMHRLPRDWLLEMHFPIAKGVKWCTLAGRLLPCYTSLKEYGSVSGDSVLRLSAAPRRMLPPPWTVLLTSSKGQEQKAVALQ